MSDPSPQQLLGHLLGALDDDEQDWLDTRLENDSEYRRQWAHWCRRLAQLQGFRPDFEPPAGLAERTCQFVAEYRRKEAKPPAQAPIVATGDYIVGSGSYLGWADVVMLSVLLVLTVGAIFPAINAGRMQAKVIACQDRLQKISHALDDYAARRDVSLTQLTNDRRLSKADAMSTAVLRTAYIANSSKTLPDAWAMAQNIDERPTVPAEVALTAPVAEPVSETALATSPTVAPTTVYVRSMGRLRGGWFAGRLLPGGQRMTTLREASTEQPWPGTWRDGTADGPSTPSPADLALLADAPSVDMPGQAVQYHGGMGRNVLYADGHVKMMPSSMPLEDDEQLIDLRNYSPRSSRTSSTPITFVSQ